MDKHEIDLYWIERMACLQLVRMIEKGKMVDECKAEWKRRWKLDYPLLKTMKGVREYEG